MGIESVSYRFDSPNASYPDLLEWLSSRGSHPGERDRTFVLSELDFWIDLSVRSGSDGLDIQFRVAVTNPPSVITVMHEVLVDLITRFGGRVTDAPRRRTIAEADLLDTMRVEFGAARSRFTDVYGEVILPVSGGEVFSRLRAEFG